MKILNIDEARIFNHFTSRAVENKLGLREDPDFARALKNVVNHQAVRWEETTYRETNLIVSMLLALDEEGVEVFSQESLNKLDKYESYHVVRKSHLGHALVKFLNAKGFRNLSFNISAQIVPPKSLSIQDVVKRIWKKEDLEQYTNKRFYDEAYHKSLRETGWEIVNI